MAREDGGTPVNSSVVKEVLARSRVQRLNDRGRGAQLATNNKTEITIVSLLNPGVCATTETSIHSCIDFAQAAAHQNWDAVVMAMVRHDAKAIFGTSGLPLPISDIWNCITHANLSRWAYMRRDLPAIAAANKATSRLKMNVPNAASRVTCF